MGRYLKDIIKYMIDSLQSTEGIVVGHLSHWLWCWMIWNLVCFTSNCQNGEWDQRAQFWSPKFGLSLLLRKISKVVRILRKLETGLVSKKVVSVIEQDHGAWL